MFKEINWINSSDKHENVFIGAATIEADADAFWKEHEGCSTGKYGKFVFQRANNGDICCLVCCQEINAEAFKYGIRMSKNVGVIPDYIPFEKAADMFSPLMEKDIPSKLAEVLNNMLKAQGKQYTEELHEAIINKFEDIAEEEYRKNMGKMI